MSFGFKEIVVIAIIVILVFGTKKLRSLGSDLGSSVKGFKDAMDEGEGEAVEEKKQQGEQQINSDADAVDEKKSS